MVPVLVLILIDVANQHDIAPSVLHQPPHSRLELLNLPPLQELDLGPHLVAVASLRDELLEGTRRSRRSPMLPRVRVEELVCLEDRGLVLLRRLKQCVGRVENPRQEPLRSLNVVLWRIKLLLLPLPAAEPLLGRAGLAILLPLLWLLAGASPPAPRRGLFRRRRGAFPGSALAAPSSCAPRGWHHSHECLHT